MLTIDDEMVSNLECGVGIGLSDNAVLSYNMNDIISTANKSEPRFNYHKGDYKSMNNILAETDWVVELKVYGKRNFIFRRKYNVANNYFIPYQMHALQDNYNH